MNTNDHLIDDMLSAFFKAEMPKQWPALDFQNVEVRSGMPVPASLAMPTERSNKSRMALAVSAALIFGGMWYLSDRFDHQTTQTPVGGIGNGSANSKTLLKFGNLKPKAEKVSNLP